MNHRFRSVRLALSMAIVLIMSFAAVQQASALPPNPVNVNVIGFAVDADTSLGIAGASVLTNIANHDPCCEGPITGVSESDGRVFFQKLATPGTSLTIAVTEAAGYDVGSATFSTEVPTTNFATIHFTIVLPPNPV